MYNELHSRAPKCEDHGWDTSQYVFPLDSHSHPNIHTFSHAPLNKYAWFHQTEEWLGLRQKFTGSYSLVSRTVCLWLPFHFLAITWLSEFFWSELPASCACWTWPFPEFSRALSKSWHLAFFLGVPCTVRNYRTIEFIKQWQKWPCTANKLRKLLHLHMLFHPLVIFIPFHGKSHACDCKYACLHFCLVPRGIFYFSVPTNLNIANKVIIL